MSGVLFSQHSKKGTLKRRRIRVERVLTLSFNPVQPLWLHGSLKFPSHARDRSLDVCQQKDQFVPGVSF